MKVSPLRFRLTGFTLAEMVISLAILGMISAVCGSAMVFATRSIESGYSGPGAASVNARNASDWMSDDLKVATAFTERTATALTLIVPDRTGDGVPETIRYAWSGAPGSKIKTIPIPAYSVTREFNGGNPSTLLTNARSFTLTYETRDVGAEASKDSDETVLSWHEGAAGANEQLVQLHDKSFISQSFRPLLARNAQTWSLTKVRLKLQKNSLVTGTVTVELRNTDSSGSPGATVLGSASVDIASLPTVADWQTITFATAVTGLDIMKRYAFVVSAKPGHSEVLAYLAQDTAAGDSTQTSTTSDKTDRNWDNITSGTATQFYVYGTQAILNPS